MHQPTRLFDVIEHQLQHYPKQDMLCGKVDGKWIKYSTADVAKLTMQMSAGLLQLGLGNNSQDLERLDKVAIISSSKPEWLITDLACQQIGTVLVPIYPTISPQETEYVLNDAAASILFIGDEVILEKVLALKDRLPSIREIYTFKDIPGQKHWSEILSMGSEADYPKIESIKESIAPKQLATIIYTSGTTGFPKGVMLSHDNIMSNVRACSPYLPVNKQARALSFLPLNHIFERMVSYVYLGAGVSIYYAESMDTIADNLKEVKPSIFTTVPRLLEKVYEKIMATGLSLTGIKRALFFWAIDLGKKYEINKKLGWWYNLQLSIANKLIFNKWREALGGNIQAVVVGAAACQMRLLKIFTAAGIPILEGYGLSETSPVIAVNRMDVKDRMFGTVGPIISNVEVKIAEDGEILCKGPNVTIGYYKRPDLTGDAITDGWFHTGDIGMLVDNKFLKITDRKKELFKTSGGKFVAPQPIENKFKESPFIEQLIVIGEDQKFTSALIVPNFHNLRDWAKKQGLNLGSREEMLKNPDIIAHYDQIVEKYNQFFNHVEQIKKFSLLPDEWTVDTGELTPTLKLKRKIIVEKYAKEIEQIYTS